MNHQIILESNNSYDCCVDATLEFSFENGDELFVAERGYNIDSDGREREWPLGSFSKVLVSGSKARLVFSAICVNGKTEEVTVDGSKAKVAKFSFPIGELPTGGNYFTEKKYGQHVSGGGQSAHLATYPATPENCVAVRDTSWIGQWTGRQHSIECLFALPA